MKPPDAHGRFIICRLNSLAPRFRRDRKNNGPMIFSFPSAASNAPRTKASVCDDLSATGHTAKPSMRADPAFGTTSNIFAFALLLLLSSAFWAVRRRQGIHSDDIAQTYDCS